jgi:hypothetical protein
MPDDPIEARAYDLRHHPSLIHETEISSPFLMERLDLVVVGCGRSLVDQGVGG